MTNPYDNRPNDDLPSYGDYSSSGSGDRPLDQNFGYGQPGPSAYPGSNDPSQGFMVNPNPGAGKRLGAFVIDFVLFGIVAGILIAVIASGDMMDYADAYVAWDDAGQTGPMPELAMGKFYLGALLSLVLWFIYRVLMESKFGRTIGKMALGIAVVGDDGQKLTAQQSLIRNSWYLAIAVAGYIPLIGGFVAIGIYAALGVLIARDPQNQHLCDKWAKAHVVNAR
ncbi:RDD family protein [Corynebacterium glyciniphilum]|uniref:RDD family protein n=1 Tax=Corynebacterium glyciniphilum TaxID=1404244 RepID=UPI0011AB8C54|nr:RDD family protein [Corynebacterium glyciniphilum]